MQKNVKTKQTCHQFLGIESYAVFDEEANFHMALIQKCFRISSGFAIDRNRVEAPDDDNHLLCLLLSLSIHKERNI